MVNCSNCVGQRLGNYRLVRLLGQGNVAEVYLGEHTSLATHAAIKILSTRVALDDIARFQREAGMLANLVHPHIVRVLDFGIDDHIPYLVMDYAAGGTLRTRHPKGTHLAIPTVVAYVKQCAQALQYVHDQKLIHCAVKPENMLIARNGDILLSDFGYAPIVQRSPSQGTKDMADTIAYMAPEQLEAYPCPASDQYSLGIVVYEWLSGNCPFQGSSTEIALKHSVTPPSPLRQQLPTLPLEIEQVVFTALAKKPEDRFVSVGAFAMALEQASQPGQSLSSLFPGEVPLMGQPSRRTVVMDLVRLALVGSRITWFAGSPGSFLSPAPRTTPPALPIGTTLYTCRGHSDAVSCVAWSPDGKRIASGSWGDIRENGNETVQIWDAADGSNVLTHHRYPPGWGILAWSPDGKRIASGGGREVQIWDAADGSNVYTYGGHFDVISSAAWSPDGKHIASASRWYNAVQIWNAADGSNVLTYGGHSDAVNCVAWSPDGKYLASGSFDKTVQIWNAADGSNVYTYRGRSDAVTFLAWSPDGKRIACGEGLSNLSVQVWNVADGSNVCSYRGHSNTVDAVAWSPDGKCLASGSFDKTVQIWNAADGSNVYTYGGHSEWVTSVAWSPDGKRIASGSFDKTVQVWVAS